jgi:hypothetical protein
MRLHTNTNSKLCIKKVRKTSVDTFRNLIIKVTQEDPERPRAELCLLADKQEEESQDSGKNVPSAGIILLEINREN